jgi:methyl-accepting chemotaxis protein
MIQKGASEQARDSIHQMAGGVARVAVLAQETQLRSERVSDLTAEGESAAAAAASDMEHLASSFSVIEERVRPLLQHAGEIGAAAQLIHKIASQTKLLSLNATIEAVRAGERGAGFAVVAEEVRKLADASSTASLQITSAVTAIQDGTATVAEGIEQAAVVVHAGSEHVRSTYELLAPIRTEAGDTLERNREIATAMGAEAQLAASAVESVTQVLDMSEQTESVVGQALETSLSISKAMDEILSAVGPAPPALPAPTSTDSESSLEGTCESWHS